MASVMFRHLDLTTEEEKRILDENGGKMIFSPIFFDYYDVMATCLAGEYNESKGNGTRAIKLFEKCIDIYEKNINKIKDNLSEMPSELKEQFLKNAKTNYYASIYGIANCYYHGIGVKVDYDKAFPLFKKAADEYDDADAQNILGVMYNGGLGVEKDDEKSAEYFEKAAVQGNMFAQNSIGRFYEFFKKDIRQAIYWYKRSAEKGYDLAAENLMRVQGADIHELGSQKIPGTDIKAADFFEKIKREAENGNFEAQESLAEFYLTGAFVAPDKEKGISLLKKYADEGNYFSQYNLGVMYKEGSNVPMDKEKAFNYFKLAAKQGIISAKYNLGVAYFSAIGTEVNVRKSFQWLLSAAKDGHPDAQYMIGIYYNYEIGCEFNQDETIYWLTKAAEQGHYYAQINLIFFCQAGFIYEKNADATLRKWTKALRQNREGNKGYSEPMVKIGEIPDINDYDEEDKNYKMPQKFINESREWGDSLPKRYQNDIVPRNFSSHKKNSKSNKKRKKKRK